VSLVPTTVEPYPVAERPTLRSKASGSWLIVGCYLLSALLVTARLWADPAGRMQAGDAQDVNLFAWFMRYSATAVSHGRLPALVTTALNAPRGVNMMWNTSFMLPGILLSPVTLLAGPQVSLTIVLTLSIAGSAASLFWVLRRWGASLPAATLGGAVYGFSPALLNSGLGHYQLAFAVLPPLIIDALLRIVTGRGHGVRTGAWLGLLTAAQLFIGEELLVYTAVAGLVLVVTAALGHPRAARGRARDAAAGVLTGAGVALLICWYPLWVQFRGPLHEHSVLTGSWSGNLAYYVDPSGNVLFHSKSSATFIASYILGLPEVLAYLGWPLIAVLVAAAIAFWRDPRVRAVAVTCAVLELCNLGGGPLLIRGFRLSGSFLPYHWLQGLPAMAQVIPARFCILGAGAAGAVLAFSLDRARSAAAEDQAWRGRLAAAVAALAVLPLIPLPYRTAPVPAVPVGWQAAISRLRLAPGARVLVVPVPLAGRIRTAPMRWQADTGEPGSLVGGYFIGPSPTGQAVFSIDPMLYAAEYLDRLWSGRARFRHPALVRSALAYWRPAAVVAVTREGSQLGQSLIGLLGPPAVHVRRVLAWRL
jgi:dolichyl-phosphate beta-glucosyltransferase